MIKGFRDFVLRGNVVDLAVAVVIGTAFTALVTAVTKSLLQPLINIFLGGGVSGGTKKWHGQTFDFGAVINAALTFLITAAVVYFLVVVPTKKLLERLQRGQEAPPAAVPEDVIVLREIRDALLAQRNG
ncbi:large conductance mechanosensitive channel [Motilibacter peucedani]|uniref:Large-conductance mechanosensitive channel n=1 Tax=Motilibacter peucedani TaxID=598650 RepID=A0A420XK96_9ACTN|nr:large conductance mechanosensitive channel protein MscL [Motilibacter peucedani]RKS68564.1 large conductance mechanosensitive channel [Motilibacter peucedani]